MAVTALGLHLQGERVEENRDVTRSLQGGTALGLKLQDGGAGLSMPNETGEGVRVQRWKRAAVQRFGPHPDIPVIEWPVPTESVGIRIVAVQLINRDRPTGVAIAGPGRKIGFVHGVSVKIKVIGSASIHVQARPGQKNRVYFFRERTQRAAVDFFQGWVRLAGVGGAAIGEHQDAFGGTNQPVRHRNAGRAGSRDTDIESL